MSNETEISGVAGRGQARHSRWGSVIAFLRDRFDLSSDSAAQAEVVDNIAKGVEFRGTNLWILIFATLIASIGLNVNSMVVIIGAMLISPLMGPIMGIGISLGINDFGLLKRSLRNLGFMTLVSITAATLYFMISPLSVVQSELLARTAPTTYDVLIALFGGLAGIVAQTRRDRASMVIVGVAIATTLLPPLCTAGFGIATGRWHFVLGAGYMFVINAIFIAFATYLMVVFLHYDKKVFLDKARQERVRRTMAFIVVATIVPSVIIALRIIGRTTFDNNADRFVHEVFDASAGTIVMNSAKAFHIDGRRSQIEVTLAGKALSTEVIETLTARLPQYGLKNTSLVVNQLNETLEGRIDLSTMNLNYAALLGEKNNRIAMLESRLAVTAPDTLSAWSFVEEAGVVVDNVQSIAVSRQIGFAVEGRHATDTTLVCVVRPVDEHKEIDRAKLARWLTLKTKEKNVKIYVE
ncbi:membrane protein [Bacteroidia bacterium]|nr:membrane protein [Bacteroidia bacterium]